jgi:hypothetical protein
MHPCRTAYMPVVHCGSVRQAALVVYISELCSSGARGMADGLQLRGGSLAPAVAAAAALLCSVPQGTCQHCWSDASRITALICCGVAGEG